MGNSAAAARSAAAFLGACPKYSSNRQWLSIAQSRDLHPTPEAVRERVVALDVILLQEDFWEVSC